MAEEAEDSVETVPILNEGVTPSAPATPVSPLGSAKLSWYSGLMPVMATDGDSVVEVTVPIVKLGDDPAPCGIPSDRL